MLESVILILIQLAILALVIWLVLWVINTLAGITLPGRVVQIIWIIFALIAILMLVRLMTGGGRWGLL